MNDEDKSKINPEWVNAPYRIWFVGLEPNPFDPTQTGPFEQLIVGHEPNNTPGQSISTKPGVE